jgi:hypothetical protein
MCSEVGKATRATSAVMHSLSHPQNVNAPVFMNFKRLRTLTYATLPYVPKVLYLLHVNRGEVMSPVSQQGGGVMSPVSQSCNRLKGAKRQNRTETVILKCSARLEISTKETGQEQSCWNARLAQRLSTKG